jgi:hypothetical protein
MAKKGDNTQNEILGRMKPFPPSPMLSVYLQVSPSRKAMPMIFGGAVATWVISCDEGIVFWYNNTHFITF